jgi:hypothetical protein
MNEVSQICTLIRNFTTSMRNSAKIKLFLRRINLTLEVESSVSLIKNLMERKAVYYQSGRVNIRFENKVKELYTQMAMKNTLISQDHDVTKSMNLWYKKEN